MALILSGINGIAQNKRNWAILPEVGGRLRLPNQPIFYAFKPVAVGSGGVTGAGARFTFDTTRINVGNHFNTETHRFTAPINGVYEFHAEGLFRYQGSNSPAEFSFFVNGGNVNTRGMVYSRMSGTSAHTPCHTVLMTQLYAGDAVDVRVVDATTNDFYVSENLAYFCGKLIG
jgi:hypothetical protein